MPLAPEPGRFCWQRSFQGADGLPGWSRGGPRSIGVPMSVHDRAPRLRDGRRAAKPGAAGFAVWVEGTGIALLGEAAPASCTWRGACVHRSAQARVSRQYHRMSSHALPPSGIIWSWGRGMPHSQHETTAAWWAAGPAGEEVPVASAMTASPSASRAAVRACRGGAAAGACSDRGCPRCARLRAPTSSREMPRPALARRPASVAWWAGRDPRTMLPGGRGPRRVAPIRGAGRTFGNIPRSRVSASGDTQQTKPARADVPSANPARGAGASYAGCGWEGRRRPGGSRRRTGWSWRTPTGRPRR